MHPKRLRALCTFKWGLYKEYILVGQGAQSNYTELLPADISWKTKMDHVSPSFQEIQICRESFWLTPKIPSGQNWLGWNNMILLKSKETTIKSFRLWIDWESWVILRLRFFSLLRLSSCLLYFPFRQSKFSSCADCHQQIGNGTNGRNLGIVTSTDPGSAPEKCKEIMSRTNIAQRHPGPTFPGWSWYFVCTR